VVNIQRQIDYWLAGADDDIITADLLIREGRILHGLFFCHLVIEKALKAHCVKKIEDVAPRTHNLVNLSEIAGLTFEEETQIFIGILMKYQLQGRYPDYNPVLPALYSVEEYLNKTKNLLRWLKVKL
jgi:HEPN domain-containing protein